MKYKNSQGEYVCINAVSDNTTAEQLAAIEAKGNDFIAHTPDAQTISKLGEDFAPTYSSENTYAVGDYCTYNYEVYRCKTTINTPENWTSGHWTKLNIGDELKNACITQIGTQVVTAEEATIYPSFDNLPRGKVVFVNASNSGITNSPVSNFIGTVLTYARNQSTVAGIIQLAVQSAGTTGFTRYGDVFVRTCTSSIWSTWKNLGFVGDIPDQAITRYATMITTDSNLSDLTGTTMSADDFPPNKIIYIGAATLNGTNFASVKGVKTGVYLTMSHNNSTNNGNTQLFISKYGSATRWKVGGAWTSWSVNESVPDVYYVGATRTYTSLTSLLIDLRSDTDKMERIIYIDSGVYDIFNEYVAQLNAGRLTMPDDDITSSDYFYPYNAFVPNNTRLVGLGDVTLKFTPTVAQLESLSNNANKTGYGASRTWSPLNILGNVEVENITVEAHNCRYGLHNDDHNNYTESVQKYINCRFLYEYSDTDSQNRRLGFNDAIGFGINNKSIQEYDNCEFYVKNGTGRGAFYGHGPSGTSSTTGTIILNNCVIHSDDFGNTNLIRLQTLSTNVTNKVKTIINNCYVNGGINLNMYYKTSVQSFDVETLNTNRMTVSRTIASGGTIVDPYTVTMRNPLEAPTALAPMVETNSYS